MCLVQDTLVNLESYKDKVTFLLFDYLCKFLTKNPDCLIEDVFTVRTKLVNQTITVSTEIQVKSLSEIDFNF